MAAARNTRPLEVRDDLGVIPDVATTGESFTVGNDYQNDWGGPSLVGVLAVHMMPGLLAAAVLVWLGSVTLRRHQGLHR